MRSMIRFAGMLVVLLAVSATVSAGPKRDAAKINVSQSIVQNLQSNTGRYAMLKLKSGDTISGTIGPVANGRVLIQEVKDISYYDALVSVSEISAVLMQVRGFK